MFITIIADEPTWFIKVSFYTFILYGLQNFNENVC